MFSVKHGTASDGQKPTAKQCITCHMGFDLIAFSESRELGFLTSQHVWG